MTTKKYCVVCFLAAAIAVTSAFNEPTSSKEPPIRIARSPEGSVSDAIFGANIQLIGQAARSGQSVLESKLNAARSMLEAGSDIIGTKVQAATDMAGVALTGGKIIAGTALGSVADTADGLAVFLGYPQEVISRRRRRDSDKGKKQREDEDDDKYDDDDDETNGKSGENDKYDEDEDYDEDDDENDKSDKKEDDGNYKSRKKDKTDDDGDNEKENDKKEKKDKKNNRRSRDTKENRGMRSRRSLELDESRGRFDGSQTVRLVGFPCMGCKTEQMSRTVALKGGAFGAGAVKFVGEGKNRASGAVRTSGAGLVGGMGGVAGATGGGLGATGGNKVKAFGVAGGFKAGVVGRKRREARRFGGGRSRFLPARGGGSKKGQSDGPKTSESSGSSSARLRQKRAIIQHVLQQIRRDKRQEDSTTAPAGKGGKKDCHSFHSFEEDEEEKKFWESFHNMMNEHDDDWNFDFEAEICGTGSGSTAAVSTNAVEADREATTPLPPTIDA